MNINVRIWTILLWLTCLPAFLTVPLPKTCGYDSCNKGIDGMINVHIVCHTHDDVGWLKTVDQYFYGSKQNIQNAGVQYILDSVVQELMHDPQKKFIYVETAFFYRWWRQQNDHLRHQVQQLVRNGQLEFISGGWCMNDEATTHYNDIIDQMTLGFRFLNDTFGECGRPRVGWQIDPFGHSREQASLFAQMSFDGLFLGRIDYEDKTERQKTKTMEFLWHGSSNLGQQADLFTGILPNTYSPPSGFCFDILCGDEPIMDDPRMKDYNVDRRVNEFLNIVKEEAKEYATNNLIITMGNDFNYQNAHTWYKNLDKLIKHVNERQTNGSKVNLFYSTPSCYLNSLNKANTTWTSKSDDFFPYASDPHAFWTGYFTSRPAIKGYTRHTNNFLQVCKQLDALAMLGPESQGDVKPLMKAQAVAQHHDAVSGTEKQHVANDYAQRLSEGVAACQETVNEAYRVLMPKTNTPAPTQVFCNLLNISQCTITETDKPVAVTFYNPLAHVTTHFARIPVVGKGYKVLGPKGETVEVQLVPISDAILRIPGRVSKAVNELIFEVQMPQLGYSTYFIRKSNNIQLIKTQLSHVFTHKGQDVGIQNKRVALVVDGKTGLLKEYLKIQGKSHQVSQSFHYYQAMAGDNTRFDKRASGAYIFRPNGTVTQNLAGNVTVKVVKGPLVEEIHQTYNDWLTQVIRVYRNQDVAEFQWVVGPIPVIDKIGKEIVIRFDSKIKSGKKFYTDANGRETLERIRDFRPTFKLNKTEPTSENYYPINSHIYIKGQDRSTKQQTQMTVLLDRAQGGSSSLDGSVELMVHRRLLHDDSFGVGEPLNEPGIDGKGLVVLGKHLLKFDDINEAAANYKKISEKLFMAPSLSFSEYDGDEDQYIKNYKTEFAGLETELPPNVHLLTLEQWKSGSILARVEHRFEKGEDEKLSKPVQFSLQAFTTFDVESAKETNLGANQYIDQIQRMRWSAQTQTSKDETNSLATNLNVTLNPMQIRTAVLKPKAKSLNTM